MAAVIYDLELYRMFQDIRNHLINEGFLVNFNFHDPFFQETTLQFVNDEMNWSEYCIAMASYVVSKNQT